MSEPFQYSFRVRFSECDAQGVVFNARYGDYVSLASYEFMRALGLARLAVSCAVVKQTIEWRSSAGFDERLVARVLAREVRNSAFVLVTEFCVAQSGKCVAVAETTYVLLDVAGRSSKELPSEVKVALTRGCPGVVVDHSGCSNDRSLGQQIAESRDLCV